MKLLYLFTADANKHVQLQLFHFTRLKWLVGSKFVSPNVVSVGDMLQLPHKAKLFITTSPSTKYSCSKLHIAGSQCLSKKGRHPMLPRFCVDPCNINTSPLNHHHMPSWLRCIICYVGACGNSRFAILWEDPCKPPSRREYIVDQMTTKQ